MRLLKRFRPHSDQSSRQPSTSPPPPPYPDLPSSISRTSTALEDGEAHIRPRTSVSASRYEDDPERDIGVRVTTTQEGGQPAVVVEDPNLLAMFLEDYARTKVYIRELEWKVAMRKALRRHLYKWYALAIVIITISILLSTKHEDIVEFCRPVTARIRSWPGGWLIPLVLLIVVSFPPLVGHEIIGILCGLIWGLGAGFGILAAGTFLGEIGVWIAFKWWCTARAARFEKRNSLYSSLTQLIREKSFMFMLILRFSAVPGHITTAVSASAGANFYAYLAAAFLTLPKQLTIAYLGTAFGAHSRKDTMISATTTVLTLLATVVAAVYIYYQMRLVMRRRPASIPCIPTTMQEVQALTLDLSDSTLGRRATEAAIKSAPHDRLDAYAQLQARQPWLLAGRTLDEKGLSRARSLPGPLSDEQLKWLAEIQSGSGMATPMKEDEAGPMIRLEELTDRWDGHRVASTLLSRSGTPIHNPRPGLYTSDSTASGSFSPRGTMSLDLPREPGDRLGGREIADDADLFALSRGARRPDYGRMRGESRAALLGRPDWDERSDAGSERGTTIDSRSGGLGLSENGLLRPDSTAASSGPSMDQGKLREYGRPRGESGAALLGRPDTDAE